MQDREKGGPFLEEDVDHLVRDQTRRCFEGHDAPWAACLFGATSPEECIGVDIRRQSASLLSFLLERLCVMLDSAVLEDVRGRSYQQGSGRWSCPQSTSRGLRRRATVATAVL